MQNAIDFVMNLRPSGDNLWGCEEVERSAGRKMQGMAFLKAEKLKSETLK
jgi:hypothetical protein